MCSGQASIHFGSLQFRQQSTSIRARSSVNPSDTSRHVLARSSMSGSGSFCRRSFGFRRGGPGTEGLPRIRSMLVLPRPESRRPRVQNLERSALFRGDGSKCGDLLLYFLASAMRAFESNGRQVGDVENLGEFLLAIQANIHIVRHTDFLPFVHFYCTSGAGPLLYTTDPGNLEYDTHV